MNLEITQKEDKPLMGRQEIVASMTFEGATPSRNDVRKEIANKASAKEELVVVKDIYTVYGEQKAEVSAYVYKNEDSMKKIELPWAVERHTGKKKEADEGDAPAEKPAEAPAEAAPADAGGEEKAEEVPKAEEKPAEEAPKEEKPTEAPSEEKKEEPAEEKKETEE